MAIREMKYVSLANALALTLLMAKQSPDRYERAAVRWHARLELEAKGLRLADSPLAAQGAMTGPGADAAGRTLAQLARTYGITRLESVLQRAAVRVNPPADECGRECGEPPFHYETETKEAASFPGTGLRHPNPSKGLCCP
jgi:hypothetical protein